MNNFMLEARDVSKSYRSGVKEVRAVDGVNCGIRRGESVAVVGPSGAGKTTILGSLLALNPCFDELYILAKDHDELLYRALQDDPRLVLQLQARDRDVVFPHFRLVFEVLGRAGQAERQLLLDRRHERLGPPELSDMPRL